MIIMDKVLVSCIIPTHNRQKLLPRAIKSILNQSYTNLEIIIVNDASTDDTLQVIDEYKKLDSRIKCITNDTPKGGSGARNIGITHSHGKYIALLDDDDEFMPDKIENQLNFLTNNPKYKMVYGGSIIITKEHKKIRRIPKYSFAGANYILGIYCQFSPPTALIDKDCFTRCGLFDESLPAYQDWDMWLRISKDYKIASTKDVVCYIHQEHELPRIGLKKDAVAGYIAFRDKHYSTLSISQKILHSFKQNYLMRYAKQKGLI